MTAEIQMTDTPIVTNPTLAVVETERRRRGWDRDHPRYKWVALSNTTVGTLLATINASIVLISEPRSNR